MGFIPPVIEDLEPDFPTEDRIKQSEDRNKQKETKLAQRADIPAKTKSVYAKIYPQIEAEEEDEHEEQLDFLPALVNNTKPYSPKSDTRISAPITNSGASLSHPKAKANRYVVQKPTPVSETKINIEKPKQGQKKPSIFQNIATSPKKHDDKPKLREIPKHVRDCQCEIIQFGDNSPTLEIYKNFTWKIDERKMVEFFPGEFVQVKLITINNPKLEEILNIYVDGNSIALDLEWYPDENNSNNPIALYQFCTSKGALLIRSPQNTGDINEIQLKILQKFLETHHFVMKGTVSDVSKLKSMFGQDFKFNMEDVEQTILTKNNLSRSFKDMINKFAGIPVAEFKDKNISTSNWQDTELLSIQVLYAAFDVVGLSQCLPSFEKYRTRENNRAPRENQNA